MHRYLQAGDENSNRYERLSAGILTPAVEKVPCVFDRRRYGFPYKANMIADMRTALTYLDICVSVKFPSALNGRDVSITHLPVNISDHGVDAANNARSIACKTDLKG